MLDLFGKKKRKIEFLDNLFELVFENELSVNRKMEILYIDDEYYSAVEKLGKNQFNVTYINDCNNPLIACPFDIVIVDIKKVAVDRSELEGLGLAIDIKNNYPDKKVYIYSTHDQKIMESHKKIAQLGIDYVKVTGYKYIGILKKDQTAEELLQTIKKAAGEISSNDYQWKHIKYQLMKTGINEEEINKVNSMYEAFRGKADIEKAIDDIDKLKLDKKVVFSIIKLMISGVALIK